jgi:hypothetical protein
MTDPVHIAAARLLDYLDGDADSGGETLLTYRPYLTILVDELRGALDRSRHPELYDHDPATCKYCAPIPRKPVESSVRHDAPSR